MKTGKKRFTFRGCGWKAVDTTSWSEEKKAWIQVITDLFEQMFGGDFLKYKYDKDHGTKVDEELAASILEYSHKHWEDRYETKDADTDVDPAKLCLPRSTVNSTNQCYAPKQWTASKRCLSQVSVSLMKCPSPKTVVVEDDNDAAEIQTESSILQEAMKKATTRAEVAALYHLIPPVSCKSSKLNPVYDRICTSDPFCISERPCESDIQKARKLLRDERKAGKNPSGIEIEVKGEFSENSLSVLQQFCTITATYHKVSSERNWLSGINCCPGDLALLQDALWHHPASIPFLRYEKKGIDPTSFADLVEERYIDSFIIDVCISKFLDESGGDGGNPTVYFPTDLFDWMTVSDRNFVKKQLANKTAKSNNGNNLQQILVPVYMPNHWGLVYIDLLNTTLYFDDGLKLTVPSSVLSVIKQLLDLLLEMFPSNSALQSKFWKCSTGFQRFGMPSQAAVDSRMIGVGSCGIGVIMAARDIILSGPSCVNNFQWRYGEMDVHRNSLMLQILKWRN